MVSPVTAFARAVVGIVQGIALFFLFRATQTGGWPATDGQVFAPLLLVAVFVPLLIVTALGNLRIGALALWIIIAALLCAGLGYYDIYSDPTNLGNAGFSFTTGTPGPRVMPWFSLWLALAAALFILQSLIVSAAADGKFIASYARHFDVSWKHGVQIALAVLFVAVFWGLLWLGAALFDLIQLDVLYQLIKQPWFWVPVTTLTFACALHVTDVSAGLVRGTRTLKLTLLSWLLPMMTIIAIAFLLALPFTGLEPLWNTHRATSILLASAGALVLLINTAYQDGLPEPTVTTVMRYSRLLASVVLIPFAALAAYGLYLRVQQYGWTPQRITSAACVAVLICYAVGYGIAVAHSGSALRGLQTTNVVTAYVILAVLLVLFTPIADPARISVADQVSRLESGKTPPEKFDFRFLKFDAGIYGRAALAGLAKRSDGPQAAVIAEKATQAMALTSRYLTQANAAPFVATPQSRAANISVIHPPGQALPEGFLQKDWNATDRKYLLPSCLYSNAKCEAVLLDLDADGVSEILLLPVGFGQTGTFKLLPDGSWTSLGAIANVQCPGVREALRAGQLEAVPATVKDIEVNGERLRVGAVGCARETTGPSIRATISPD